MIDRYLQDFPETGLTLNLYYSTKKQQFAGKWKIMQLLQEVEQDSRHLWAFSVSTLVSCSLDGFTKNVQHNTPFQWPCGFGWREASRWLLFLLLKTSSVTQCNKCTVELLQPPVWPQDLLHRSELSCVESRPEQQMEDGMKKMDGDERRVRFSLGCSFYIS